MSRDSREDGIDERERRSPDDHERRRRDDHGDQGCPKCGHTGTDVGSIATTGTGLSKMFDVQSNHFDVVSCTNCGYSELYRSTGSESGDIVDIFLG